jgi:hypothetical protein
MLACTFGDCRGVFDCISLIYHSFDEELLLDVETGKSMPWVRIFYQRFNC